MTKKRKPKASMGAGLIQGLQEAVAVSRGQLKAPKRSIEIPGPAPRWTADQIRQIRKEIFGLSQPLFAALLNVKTSTVRAWEQGQKTPSGAAARLLQLLAADRRVIERIAA